jgi:predicted metal-dependent hydrolase
MIIYYQFTGFFSILAEEPKKKKAKKQVTQEAFEKFSNELRNSVVLRQHSTIDDNMPTGEVAQAQQLQEYTANLETHKQQQTYIKCLMGRNLAHIKKSSGKHGKDFVENVQKFLPASYCRSEIYFMINLYELSEEYNKLRCVTVGVGRLKSKFSWVKDILKEDPVFWKCS